MHLPPLQSHLGEIVEEAWSMQDGGSGLGWWSSPAGREGERHHCGEEMQRMGDGDIKRESEGERGRWGRSGSDPAKVCDMENASAHICISFVFPLASSHPPRFLSLIPPLPPLSLSHPSCGFNQSGNLVDGSITVDGVLGLGQGKLSILPQLAGQGLLANAFALCLGGQEGGGGMFLGRISASPLLASAARPQWQVSPMMTSQAAGADGTR